MVNWKDWCWSWNSSTLATSCEELSHWKRHWCWEGLGAGGEGDDRRWDGWMASPTRWTWVWVNSGSWWWTGRPGVLQFMGSQRVGHNWATELNWIYDKAGKNVQWRKASLFSALVKTGQLPAKEWNWTTLIPYAEINSKLIKHSLNPRTGIVPWAEHRLHKKFWLDGEMNGWTVGWWRDGKEKQWIPGPPHCSTFWHFSNKGMHFLCILVHHK